MTISPFQNLILNTLDMALTEGGYEASELYFDQLTPLAILSQQAEDTDKTVSEVADETNKELENPATAENPEDQTTEDAEPRFVRQSQAFFNKEYETYND
jgi:hypothetical protein